MKFFNSILFELYFERLTTRFVLYSYINPESNMDHKTIRHSLLINNFFIEKNVRLCDNELLHFENLLSLDFVGKTIQLL